MNGSVLIEAENIDVFYGTSQILFAVSVAVTEGQTMALLGRNGAGKSTTLKANQVGYEVRRSSAQTSPQRVTCVPDWCDSRLPCPTSSGLRDSSNHHSDRRERRTSNPKTRSGPHA